MGKKERKIRNRVLENQGEQIPAGALKIKALCAVALAAFCFVIYFDSLSAPFMFDDRLNITDNPYIRMEHLTLRSLRDAMVQDKFQMRAVSNLTFALDYYVNRLDPRWMRAENIALHALASIILFLILAEFIPLAMRAPPEILQIHLAALCAALAWAGHPAHTQAVTYIVQRQTVMATAAALLCFYSYLKARTGRGRRIYIYYVVAALAFIVSAGSKEIGWVTPAFLALLEALFVSRLHGVKYGPKVYALAAALGVLLFALLILLLSATGIMNSYLASYSDLGYGPLARMATEARVVLSYLVTIFLPLHSRLAIDQQVTVSTGLFSPWTTLPAIVIIAGAVAGSIAAYKRYPLLPFLVLGFHASLAPESTFIPVELAYDHRLYMPSLFVLPPALAWIMASLRPRAALPLTLAIAALLGTMTVLRNQDWLSARRIWSDSVRKSPELYRPWSNLCGTLVEDREFGRATRACKTALEIDPKGSFARVNLGIALFALGEKKDAGLEFERAAKDDPGSALARFNYGAWLEIQGEKGRAIEEYSAALTDDPFHAKALFQRARLYEDMGRRADAIKDLELLVRLFPEKQGARQALERLRTSSASP